MRVKASARKEEGQSVSCWIKKSTVEEIDRIADRAGLTRSQLITNMLEVSVNSLTKAESYGILSIALLLRNFNEGLRSWVESIRDDGGEISGYYERGELDDDESKELLGGASLLK